MHQLHRTNSVITRDSQLGAVRRALPFVAGLFLMLLTPTVSVGQEYVDLEKTAPKTAAEAQGPLEGARRDTLQARVLFPRLSERLHRHGPFVRDTKLNFRFRTYVTDKRLLGVTTDGAWAAGGELEFLTGKWKKTFSIGLSFFTSQNVEDTGGDTGLLGPGQAPINVLGKAWAKLEHKTLALKVYRQTFDVPYLNKSDSKMIPNTFEAYILNRTETTLDFVLGQVTKIKERDSEVFVSMAEAAGDTVSDTGSSVAVLRYSPNENFSTSAMTLYTWDLYNTAYAEINTARSPEHALGLRLSAQYTHQQSVGAETLGDFSTYKWGIKGVWSWNYIVFSAAFTSTGDAPILSPYGGTSSYTSIMIFDFDRPGEEAILVGLSYDFSKVGLTSLSTFAKLVTTSHVGEGIGLLTTAEGPRNTELDLTVDYRPESGKLNGLWFRVRGAVAWTGSIDDRSTDVRVILNYGFKFL